MCHNSGVIRHHTCTDLDIPPRVKAIQLIEELQHGALDLPLTARVGVVTLGADGVDLVDEHDAWCMLLCHSEQFPHQLGPVTLMGHNKASVWKIVWVHYISTKGNGRNRFLRRGCKKWKISITPAGIARFNRYHKIGLLHRVHFWIFYCHLTRQQNN